MTFVRAGVPLLHISTAGIDNSLFAHRDDENADERAGSAEKNLQRKWVTQQCHAEYDREDRRKCREWRDARHWILLHEIEITGVRDETRADRGESERRPPSPGDVVQKLREVGLFDSKTRQQQHGHADP